MEILDLRKQAILLFNFTPELLAAAAAEFVAITDQPTSREFDLVHGPLEDGGVNLRTREASDSQWPCYASKILHPLHCRGPLAPRECPHRRIIQGTSSLWRPCHVHLKKKAVRRRAFFRDQISVPPREMKMTGRSIGDHAQESHLQNSRSVGNLCARPRQTKSSLAAWKTSWRIDD